MQLRRRRNEAQSIGTTAKEGLAVLRVITPGGETEERRAIAKFTLAGVVVKDPLAHRHGVGERVQQDIVPLQPSQVFGQVSEAPKETEQAEDDVEQDLLHRDTSAASGSGGIAMVPTSLVTDTCSSWEVVDLDQFEEVEDLENIMQAIMCPEHSDMNVSMRGCTCNRYIFGWKPSKIKKPSAREDDLLLVMRHTLPRLEEQKEIDLDDFDDLESNGTQASTVRKFFLVSCPKNTSFYGTCTP